MTWSRIVFAPDANGKRLWDYVVGKKVEKVIKKMDGTTYISRRYVLPPARKRRSFVDSDNDNLIEVDCSHMVHRTLDIAGFNIDYRYVQSAFLNSNRVAQYYHILDAKCVEPGDLIVFSGHVGIVETMRLSVSSGGYEGTFFHSETPYWHGGEKARTDGGPTTSDFAYPTIEKVRGKHYGTTRRPVRRFLRPKCMPSGPPAPDRKTWLLSLMVGALPPKDPLILDLNGDGITTTLFTIWSPMFDHDANGFAEATGWVGPDDGLLVRDGDGNGIIDDGRELFGDGTILSRGEKASSGFEALAAFDENAEWKIDAADPIFSELLVWQDADSDGYSTYGESYAYNDNYGHIAGDECLRLVGQTLHDCMRRGGDLAAGYGGEEFVLLLPDTYLGGATEFARMLNTEIEAPDIEDAHSEVADKVTVSMSVATIVQTIDDSPETLVQAADEALYEAKENGRNQVMTAPHSETIGT
ncbi:GGDEF domain-containing protein [Thermodesulfobacteriota bacterium]